MTGLQKLMVFWVVPLIIVTGISVVIGLGGQERQAELFNIIGLSVLMIWTVSYIVFDDSKKRWPETSLLVRIGRLFTFYKGE